MLPLLPAFGVSGVLFHPVAVGVVAPVVPGSVTLAGCAPHSAPGWLSAAPHQLSTSGGWRPTPARRMCASGGRAVRASPDVNMWRVAPDPGPPDVRFWRTRGSAPRQMFTCGGSWAS
ncbi:hypothetical protein GCM10009682_45550 [Luedemannella flava]|uniref:Secreted protein n=1 Tax=Luedemannella flava TaxID=349316 RepID=A0ABN2MCA2_9ACTN